MGIPFSKITLDRDFTEYFASYAKRAIYISDGSADIFKCHELYLNMHARRVSPIRVTGKYGTQLLSGFSAMKNLGLNSNIFSPEYAKEINEYSRISYPINSVARMLEEIRWFWGGYLALESSQVLLRTPYTDKDLVEFIARTPIEYTKNSLLQICAELFLYFL